MNDQIKTPNKSQSPQKKNSSVNSRNDKGKKLILHAQTVDYSDVKRQHSNLTRGDQNVKQSHEQLSSILDVVNQLNYKEEANPRPLVRPESCR